MLFSLVTGTRIKTSPISSVQFNRLVGQGPREGWAEGALAPPLFGATKK